MLCCVLCHAVLCCAVLCCAVLCCVVLCCVVLCCVVLCCVVLCCVVLCCVVSCCVVSCCVVLCRVVSCRVVLCCVVLCRVVLCCVVLCCVVSCCVRISLRYAVLCCIWFTYSVRNPQVNIRVALGECQVRALQRALHMAPSGSFTVSIPASACLHVRARNGSGNTHMHNHIEQGQWKRRSKQLHRRAQAQNHAFGA